ncbi:MAG: hypothetical protein KAV87_60830 [Desulfobacteraceae bacterium]|nr:hypothetical protein [Desulfobacteraceae bacterium]
MKNTTLHITILIGAAILFVGCAVLTVDVDVYKGPLANHKDVQVEQMAAMAIGAKPLLVELRDALEAKGPKGNLLRDAADFREEANEECWYKPVYIGPAPDETMSRFTNQNADRVNEILSLYEDRGDEQYSIFVGRARQALKDYKTAYEILAPESMEADKQLWKKIGPKKDSFKDEAESLTKSQENANAVTVLSEAIETLRSDYEEFYTKEYRNAKPLFASWNTIRDQLCISQIKDLKALQNNPLLKDKDDELAVSENAQFRGLAETKLVDFHAVHLFGLKGKKKGIFVDHVKKISWAFLDARDALERLWRAEMEAIIWLSDKSQETVFRSDPCIIDTAKASLEVIQPPDPRIIDIAKASLEVIQPRYVAQFMELNGAAIKDMPDIEYPRKVLLELTNDNLPKVSSNWIDTTYENAKKILRSAFYSEPTKTAKALLASHQFCRLKLDPKGLQIDKENLQYVSGWKFGLVRAPFEDNQKKAVPDSLTENTKKALAPEGGAFGKGRLDDGLETLIEKYLRRAEVCNPNDEELRWACKRLSDALVRFAEKVLFVANNNSLISPPKEPGLFPGLFDVTVRGIGGERFRDQLSKSFNYTLPDTDTKRYTRVLQAVGNSILVQADALQQERKHRERLKDHYEKEAAILADTLDRTSPVNRNSTGINSVKDKLSEYTTAKDVRDIWIKLLQYEHDLALYYGETKRAKEINEALEAARKKREGMIFIRPAMAYLRTSFPATSLQDNPNLTWDNMLGGHMMRSIPFGPQLRDFLDPDAKCDAQINAEIDKQFWQNINRVRVAGGGFINYAVVKDDIGNWYVKGYSANPEDIIKSAKSLALFAAGAKAGANLLPGAESDKGEKPDGGEVDDADSTKSGLERAFTKYKEGYIQQTQTDYDRLKEAISSDTGIKGQIHEVWEQNTDIVPEGSHNGVDVLRQIDKEMSSAALIHLKEVREDVREKHDDPTEQITLIFKGLGALRRFHNDLVSRIKALDLPGQGEKKISDSDGTAKEIQEEKQRAERAEKAAINAVTSAVRSRVVEILKRRRDVVGDYETALMVIGQATGQ